MNLRLIKDSIKRVVAGKNENGNNPSAKRENPELDPLDDVIQGPLHGSVFEMQTGLWNHGRKRAIQSGTTTPLPEDIRALEDHARAIARDTYRDRYDPSQNVHDAMHEAEYKKLLLQRDEAEKGEQHSIAKLRDAEDNLAKTPKAGPKPTINPKEVVAFIVAITITVAPTLHDSVFQTLGDDLLIWFAASFSGACIAAMLTWSILGGRRSPWRWIGVAAGVILGLGLGAIRLASAQGLGEIAFAIGLTIMEIAIILLLESEACGLRTAEVAWVTINDGEVKAIVLLDTAHADLKRWQCRLKELNDAIAEKIAFVEDRHNRNIHITELEVLAVKAVLDGYNAGTSENIGRVRGVSRRVE
jgi:hypothetical protein